MRSLRTAVAAAVAALALAAPAVAGAKQPHPVADAGQSQPYYHVALGDSLSIGVEPRPGGWPRSTRHGYPNRLARRYRRVKLVSFGCGGATSSSIIRGDKPCGRPHPRYRGVSPRTSQLAAAVRFIRRHRDRIAFVTIDIGANDVVGCGLGGVIDLACVGRGVTELEGNLPVIARRLRRAAGARTPLAAMTMYDPFLAYWLDGPAGKLVAKVSQGLAREMLNAEIAAAFEARGFLIADVAEAFHSYEDLPVGGASLDPPPRPVATICRLTWMCADPPRGPDIHANRRGYAVMARTFARVLRRPVRRHLRRLGRAIAGPEPRRGVRRGA